MAFYDIYHWEAHPGGQYPRPNTLDKRIGYYEDYVAKYNTSVPGLVDKIGEPVSRQKFSARWTTIFVIGLDGKIVHRDDFTGTAPESNWVIPAYKRLDKKLADLLPTDTQSPVVNVTSPTNSDLLVGGSTHSVTWKATDNSGTISSSIIYFAKDGINWVKLDSIDGNNESYTWTVINESSDECKIKIESLDPFGNRGSGVSDKFSIGATGINYDQNNILSNPVLSYTHDNGTVFLSITDQINYSLDIFNISGKSIITKKGNQSAMYNLSDMLLPGQYIIKVKSKTENYIQSIIIKK